MASRLKLDSGEKLNFLLQCPDRDNAVALSEAIIFGTIQNVEAVLGPDSNPTLFYHWVLDSALLTACQCKNEPAVEMLLKSGASAGIVLKYFLSTIKYEKCIAPVHVEILKLLMDTNDTVKELEYFLPLSKAVNLGSYDLVKLLCQHGADPSSSSALSEAASKGRCDLIGLLLSFKADVNEDRASCEALYVALKHNHADCIKLLIKHCGKIDVTRAFEVAAEGNALETLKLFPELYKTAFQDVESINRIFCSLVTKGNIEFLKFLVESGTDVMNMIHSKCQLLFKASNPDVLQFLIEHGVVVHDSVEICSHLISLIREGKSNLVKVFLASGINVNSINLKSDFGGTPLMQATNAETVRVLVDKGARVNERVSIKPFGRKRAILTTPLLEALSKGDEVLEALLENGADPEVTNSQGHSALMAASQIPRGSKKVEMLLKAGARVNRQNKHGKTALSLAAGSDYTTTTVKLLLQHGADVNAQTSNKTAILNAMKSETFEMIEMLADSGLNTRIVNMSNEDGDTPLIMAVNLFTDVQSCKLINTFITAGVDLNKTDRNSYTALMRAAERKKHLAVKALTGAGANVNARVEQSNSFCTAISLVLNQLYYNCRSLLCIEDLLNHGADTSNINYEKLNQLIEEDAPWLIPKMIQNGCVPQGQDSSSLFSLALLKGKVDLARYLSGNRILTKSDLSIKLNPLNLGSECADLLTEITGQPYSLMTLSFVEVSNAVGFGPRREERVRKTGLPPLIQTKLLFKSEDVSLVVDEEKKTAKLSAVHFDTVDFSDTYSENYYYYDSESGSSIGYYDYSD